MAIICKEEICHGTIAVVEELKVVGFHCKIHHEDQPCMIHHGEPEHACFAQMALAYFVLVLLVLINQVEEWGILQSGVKVFAMAAVDEVDEGLIWDVWFLLLQENIDE